MILASTSPRRKEILTQAGYDFIIKPSNYNENISNLVYSKELIEDCALKKAQHIEKNYDDLIISADTVVVFENRILGKPKNEKEAYSMLEKLSNKTHFVQTSICLLYKEKYLLDSEITYVTFRTLNKTDIENYIFKHNPLDKAGSYGIQDDGFNFAIKIDGNLDNVIGFPMNLFKKMLSKI